MSTFSHFTQNDAFVQHSDNFMRWLENNPDARTSTKIKIADFRSEKAGRGLIASQDIDENEELFAIPLGLVLRVKNSRATEELGLDVNDLGSWLSLIVVMIYEFLQGEASPWAPYFRVLPEHFDTPMFWTDSELRELQGSAIVNKIGKEDADTTFLERVVPIFASHANLFAPGDSSPSLDSKEGQEFLINLAHRMGSLIMAYAFDIEKEGEEEDEEVGEDGYVTDEEDEDNLPKGMVPLADILNADADRNNARLFHEDDFLTMKSIKPISAGEQIYNDYGELPRADLLRRYGYVTENYAQYDVAEIPLEKLCAFTGLDTVQSGANAPQLEFLDDAGILEDGYSIPRFPANSSPVDALPMDFITTFRALKLNPDELASLRSRNKLPKGGLSHAEAGSLVNLITERLQEYPTSLEDDVALLQHRDTSQCEDASSRRRSMAIEVRRGEKEIFKQLIALLETYKSQGQPERDNKRPRDEPEQSGESKRRMQGN